MEILELFKKRLTNRSSDTSKNTVKNYISDVRHFIQWIEKTTNATFHPQNITSDLIILYQKSLGADIINLNLALESQLSVSSMKRHLSSLRRFFTFLVHEGYVSQNPFDSLHAPINEEPTDYWHLKSFKDYLLENRASRITIKNYISDVAGFARWYEEAILPGIDKPLSSTQGFYLISQEIVNDYRKRLLEVQNAAPRTINRKLSALRRYFEFAVKKGFITNEELRLDPVKVYEEMLITSEPATLALEDIKSSTPQKRTYSKIPPVRLLQKLLIFPYLIFEEKAAMVIAAVISGTPITGIQSLPPKIAAQLASKNTLRAQSQSVGSLMNGRNIEKKFYAPDKISLLGIPIHKRLIHHTRFTRPNWYKRYHSYSFVNYVHFALLIIFASGVGVALYQNLVVKKQSSTFAAATAPPRILSFQGRLTDNLDNPITTPKQVRFMIYNNASSSSSAELWEEVRTVAPDQDGIFSILLGSDVTGANATLCGTMPPASPTSGACGIPSTVFSDNSQIWLGVTIQNTAELAPRQKIASVAYATNSEFLQGMAPITALGATDPKINTVLNLDSSGNLIISGNSNPAPTFQATSGQFTLSGKTLLLTTVLGTGTNVAIAPDGLGKIDLQKPLINTTNNGNITPGGVEVNDKFGILATESAVAAFIINNDTTGGDILAASSSGTTRFRIANDGTIADIKYNTPGGILFSSDALGTFAKTTAGLLGQCLQSAAGATPIWGNCGSGGAFQERLGALVPNNSTLDLLIGGQATSTAKFRFINVNSGTPTASISANLSDNATFISGDGTLGTTNRQTLTIGNSSLYNTTGNLLINPNGVGRLGIGTSTPLAGFDLRGNSGTLPAASISANTSFATLLLDNTGGGDLLAASASGVSNFSIRNNGDIVVGLDGHGTIYADVVDPYLIQNHYTSGNTALSFQTLSPANGDFIFKNQSTTLGTLAQAGQFQLPIAGSSAGLSIGGDTQIYRGNTDRLDLAAGDSFNIVNGTLQTGGTTRIDSSGNGTFANINITGACTGCSSAANSPFQIQAGAIVPVIPTVDFLLGANATTSAKFAVLNLSSSNTPTASISAQNVAGQALALGGDGSIQTTRNNTLTIGGNSTGDINFRPGNVATGLFLGSNGNVGIGDTTPASMLSVGNGDLFQVNSSGAISAATGITSSGTITLSGFSGANNGGVIYANASGTLAQTGTGSIGQCLLGGTTPAFGSCGSVTATNSPFQVLNGAIVPLNSTEDFLIGAQATASAKFAVLNISNGTPTASVSSGLGGNGAFFDSNGNFQTANKRQLTLGGGNTGNITVQGNGALSLADVTVNLTGASPTIGATGTNIITINGNSTGNIQFFSGSNTITNAGLATFATGLATGTNPASTGPLRIPNNSFLTARNAANTGDISLIKADTSNLVSFGANLAAFTLGGTVTGNNQNITGAGAISATSLALGTNPAAAGTLRLPNNTYITARNAANSADINLISVDASNLVSFGANTAAFTLGGSITGNSQTITALSGLTLNGGSLINSATAGTLGIGTATTTTITLGRSGQGITLPGFTGQNGVLFGTQTTGVLGQATTASSGQCLLSGASNPAWGGCGGVTATNSPFQVLNGAIVPINSTQDLLIGSQATTSAKFAILNISGSGTPTASVSSGLNGTGAYFDANGNFQTTKNHTLTIGGNTSGSLYLKSQNTTVLRDDANNSIFVGGLAGGSGTPANSTILGYAAGAGATGSSNTFVGYCAGCSNFSGTFNTFIGRETGDFAYQGDHNIFIGYVTGQNNGGSNNVFIGDSAGTSNDTGSGLVLLGDNADTSFDNLTNATAIGANAIVGASNSLVLGGTGANAVNVGIGTTAPTQLLTLAGGNFLQTAAAGTASIKSTSSISEGTVYGIYGSGKYIYAVGQGGSGFLDILDASNISSPVKIGSMTLGGSLNWQVVVSGKYAYVAGYDSGFFIVDISNPKVPKLVGSYDQPGFSDELQGLYVVNNFAYLAQGDALVVMDVTNPSSPVPVGRLNSSAGGWTQGIFVSGKYAYVAEGNSGLKIVDMSDPKNPHPIGNYNTAGFAQTVYVSGSYAYVADGNNGVVIVNVSNPSSPTLAGSYNTAGSANRVEVAGNYAYVADGNNGVVVLDVSDPTSPSLVDTISTSQWANDIFVDGKYAYIAGATAGDVEIIDLNGIQTPSLYAGNILTNKLNVSEDAIFGNMLFVQNGLNVGNGGIFAQGALNVNSATNSANLIQGASIGNALLTLNQQSSQDIFTASSSGTTKFTITNSGGIGLGGSVGTSGQCITGGTTASWGACGSGGGGAFKELAGTIVPLNSTEDLLVGGQATTSAKFAVLNISGANTPTASISAQNVPGQALSLSGNGSIQAARNNTLTLGGDKTGNINLLPSNSNGSVGINTTSPLGALDIKSIGGTGRVTINNLPSANSYGAIGFSGAVDGNNYALAGISGGEVILNSPANNPLSLRQGNQIYAYIAQTTGYFGLGEAFSSPQTTFHVSGGNKGGRAAAIIDQVGNSANDIFTASASGVTRFVINNAGRVGIGTASPAQMLDVVGGNIKIDTATTLSTPDRWIGRASNFGLAFDSGQGTVLDSPANQLFTIDSDNSDNDVRKFLFAKNDSKYSGGETPGGTALFTIQENGFVGVGTLTPTTSLHVDGRDSKGNAAFIVDQTGNTSNDIFTASASGTTMFTIFNNGDACLGPSCTGKINVGLTDPPYQIDGQGYATYGISMVGVKEEYAGKVTLSYDNQKGAYAYKLDFNNFEYQSGQWVFNRIIDPDISNVGILMTPNSPAKTWYKKDGAARTITLFADRPVEISYRLTAPRFDASQWKTYTGNSYGLVAPPPTSAGTSSNDNNISVDPYFATITINQENGQWVLKDAQRNNINQIDAYSKAIIANIEAGYAHIKSLAVDRITAGSASLGNVTASTFAVAANTITIGGQDLKDIIKQTVISVLSTQSTVVSPLASADSVKTNVISPLADTSAPSMSFQNSKFNIQNSGKTVAWFDNQGNASLSGQLTAGNIQTTDISASSSTFLTSNIQDLTSNNASISGTLRAGNIIADNISGLDDKLATLAAALNNSSNQQNQTTVIPASSSAQTSSSTLLASDTVHANFGIFEQGITSMGPVTSNILTATDTLSVGHSFSITNNAINTVGADLEIQSLRQGNIAFEGGLIRMDTDGNMSIGGNLNVLGEIDTVTGVFSGSLTTHALATSLISPLAGDDLTIRLSNSPATPSGKLKIQNSKGQDVLSINSQGDILSSGSANFAKLNFNLVGQAEATSLSEAVATGSAGFATLKQGQPELTIKNPIITSKSLIYITPFGDTDNKVLYLLRQVPNTDVEDGSFTVGISGQPAPRDVQFNWLVVN